MPCTPQDIAIAVARLRAGKLVAFPTETVYGLGAAAFDAAAVTRVFAAKGRPSGNPLIVHVSSIAMARSVSSAWTPHADALAAALWPGPLSLVVAKTPSVPDVVTAGGETVAVRMPDHECARSLIEAFGAPLVGPSANLSGRVSPTTAAHVREAFATDDVFVLDGGPCRGGIESTVVDVTGEVPRVLRPGLITPAQIENVTGVRVDISFRNERIARSPGLLSSHYAPVARTIMVKTDDLTASLAEGSSQVVAITHSQASSPFFTLRLSAIPDQYAAEMYAALRDADARNPDLIVIEAVPATGTPRDLALWHAIHDRLSRACADRGDQ